MDERMLEFESNFSVLDRYGTDVTKEEFVTNPAIGREQQIKELILILLTPEKSAILIGKPGIGKTAIVEGLAYRIQKNDVPDALKGYSIVNIKTASLLGTMPSGESKVQKMIDELKQKEKMILFIDEVHMLIGATDSSSLDFANIFKEGLGRGSIKVIGATTTEEYERYILRDKAFTRRFQKVDVPEPTREETIKIMMGTLPKFEKQTGRKMKYTDFIKNRIMSFIVDITSEYKRVFALGSRYPDVSLTLLKQAFSYTVFDNRPYMDIFDIRKAIENSKNIYPDVIKKELPNFDREFSDIILEEKGEKPVEEWRKDNTPIRQVIDNPQSSIIDNSNVEEKQEENISRLKAKPTIITDPDFRDNAPSRSIITKGSNNKHAKVGSTAISRGLKEKINRQNDVKGIDELLTSSGIGVIEKKKDDGPKMPTKFTVREEIAPNVGDDFLLGRPIGSTLNISEEEEVPQTETYMTDYNRNLRRNEDAEPNIRKKHQRQDISTQNFDKYQNYFHKNDGYQGDDSLMNPNQNNMNSQEEMDNVRRIDMLMGKDPGNDMPPMNNGMPNNYQGGPYQQYGNMPPMDPNGMYPPQPPMGYNPGYPPMNNSMMNQPMPNNGMPPYMPPQNGMPNNLGNPPMMGPGNFNDNMNSGNGSETIFGAPMYGKEENKYDNIPDIYTTDNPNYQYQPQNQMNNNSFIPQYGNMPMDQNQMYPPQPPMGYNPGYPPMNNGGGSFLNFDGQNNTQESSGETLFGAPMYGEQEEPPKPEIPQDDNIILNQLMSNNMKIKDGKIVDEFPTFDKISNLSSIKSVISDVRDVKPAANNNSNDGFLQMNQGTPNTDINSKNWTYVNDNNNANNVQTGSDQNVLDMAKGNTISPATNTSEPTSNKDYYEDMKNADFVNLTELNSGKIREEDTNKYIGIPSSENKPQFDLNLENNNEEEKDFDDFYDE